LRLNLSTASNAATGRRTTVFIAIMAVLFTLIAASWFGTEVNLRQAESASAGTAIDSTALADCKQGHRESLSTAFSLGSGWRLCWFLEPKVGLVVTDAVYTTATGHSITVLKRASLAQIFVPYDDGERGQLDFPAFGSLTATVSEKDCSSAVFKTEGRPILCASVQHDNLRYEWYDYSFDSGNHSAEGACLQIHTVTPVDWYTYTNQWKFCDDGTIQGSVGAGGTLAPGYFGAETNSSATGPGDTRLALAHFHNVFWRLEFNLGSSSRISVQELNDKSDGARHWFEETAFPQEAERTDEDGRYWRVTADDVTNTDGHLLSYDIRAKNGDPYREPKDHPYTDYDFYVTEHNDCESLAAANDAPGCATSVDGFVNGESITSPVLWIQNSFHHLPRDEDEPMMVEHWQTFTPSPRNLTATTELVG
jgi:primary-amine oxidase